MNTTDNLNPTDKVIQAVNETKGFIIYDYGDSSVGIFPVKFELSGPFIFENNKELIHFTHALKYLFDGYVVDNSSISTFEQIEKENEALTAYEKSKEDQSSIGHTPEDHMGELSKSELIERLTAYQRMYNILKRLKGE